MMEAKSSERLEMRWMPVVDALGRTRMESAWVPVSATAGPAAPSVHPVSSAA